MDCFTAYISIGSNKGDKSSNLKTAIQRLGEQTHTQVDAVSEFYQTEPQDFIDQDWFVNAAVRINTRLAPESLLLFLKSIEQKKNLQSSMAYPLVAVNERMIHNKRVTECGSFCDYVGIQILSIECSTWLSKC